MSKPTNTTLIGAFVLGGIALFVTAIVVLGSGRFFSKNITCIAYFSGSVKGLSVGSSVRFRGAAIGKVTDIRLEIRQGMDGKTLLPVKFELSTERLNHIESNPDPTSVEDAKMVLHDLIEHGVKANLAVESIVTGQLYVDLDYRPNDPIVYLKKYKETIEIPTVPSSFEKIKATLEQLPLEKIISSADSALTNISDFFGSEDLKGAIAAIKDLSKSDLPAAVKSLESFVSQASSALKLIEDDLDPLSNETILTLQSARKDLNRISLAAVNLEKSLNEDTSPLRYQLFATLEEINRTTRSLQELSDSLQRNPESLVFGKREIKHSRRNALIGD